MTLTKLTKLGLTYDDVMNGESAELDTYTPKEAKKAKIELLVNNSEFEKVMKAYSYDLYETLIDNENLKDERDELSENINKLSDENSKLQKEVTLAGGVTGKVNDFEVTMDNMELSLRQITESHAKDREDLVKLEKERNELLAKISELESALNEKDSAHQNEIDELHANLQSYETEYNTLAEQNNNLLADVDALNAELDAYEAGYNNLANQVDGLVQDLKRHLASAGLTDFSFDFVQQQPVYHEEQQYYDQGAIAPEFDEPGFDDYGLE